MCIIVGEETKCHELCLTCSNNSYCGNPNACTSCYPGDNKISLNYSDVIFKCSKECNGDPLQLGDYYFCDEHVDFVTSSTNFPLSSSWMANSLYLALLIISVIIGLVFIFFVIKKFVYKKYKKQKTNEIIDDAERQPLNMVKIQQAPIQPFKKLEMITNVAEFEKGEEIGGGGFSVVFKGTLRGCPVAIKVARDEGRKVCKFLGNGLVWIFCHLNIKRNVPRIKGGTLITSSIFDDVISGHLQNNSIHKELQIFDKVKHPHILEAKGVHLGIDNMLFLALRNFNLKDFFIDYGNDITFPQLKQYYIQITDGMKYLHNKNILHCDLKIENILVKDEKGEFVEISDFGCAMDLELDHCNKYVGTQTHTAYELLKNMKNLHNCTTPSKASDVWSFAVTMWQIFQKSDQLPIDFIKTEDIIKNYEAGKKLPIPATISEDFWRYIILPCFDLHPKARPSMDDLHKCLLNRVL